MHLSQWDKHGVESWVFVLAKFLFLLVLPESMPSSITKLNDLLETFEDSFLKEYERVLTAAII
jgi:hypothetical protein